MAPRDHPVAAGEPPRAAAAVRHLYGQVRDGLEQRGRPVGRVDPVEDRARWALPVAPVVEHAEQGPVVREPRVVLAAERAAAERIAHEPEALAGMSAAELPEHALGGPVDLVDRVGVPHGDEEPAPVRVDRVHVGDVTHPATVAELDGIAERQPAIDLR